MTNNKIQMLSDLKKALNTIPDKHLEDIGVGCFDGNQFLSLGHYGDEIEGFEFWESAQLNFPEILEIDKWIRTINKAAIHAHLGDDEADKIYDLDDPISSDMYDEESN